MKKLFTLMAVAAFMVACGNAGNKNEAATDDATRAATECTCEDCKCDPCTCNCPEGGCKEGAECCKEGKACAEGEACEGKTCAEGEAEAAPATATPAAE
jgi:hypothetical protein